MKLVGYLAIEASKLATAGKTVDEIVSRLRCRSGNHRRSFVVDDLRNLVRGGRLSNASGLLAVYLNQATINLLTMKVTKSWPLKKFAHGKKRCYEWKICLLKQLQPLIIRYDAIIIDGNDPEGGDNWQKQIKNKFQRFPSRRSYFGPVIGTHLGEKALKALLGSSILIKLNLLL